MKLEIEITGCNDCPMKHRVYEQGFSANCCHHPNSPKKGYESALPQDGSTPDWCAAKTSRRTWVGLTDEEILLMSRYDLEYAALIGEVQRKLKEKNNGT